VAGGAAKNPGRRVVRRISDAQQAAYFRDLQTKEWRRLNADIASMRRLLEVSTKSGDRIETNRLHLLVRQHQSTLTPAIMHRYAQVGPLPERG
jgi:hypothetical protein